MIGDNVIWEHSSRLKAGEVEGQTKPDRRRCRACKKERQARNYKARVVRSATVGQHDLETLEFARLSAKVNELARSRDEWKATLDRLSTYERSTETKLSRLRKRLTEARTNYDALTRLHADADEAFQRRILQWGREEFRKDQLRQDQLRAAKAPEVATTDEDDGEPF